jgi:hypothetical protein
MKLLSLLLIGLLFISCETRQNNMRKIIFLHHSTGESIWIGKTNRYVYKFTKKGDVKSCFLKLNRKYQTNYSIEERNFPAESPYGWKNLPFDYYNIWVKNAGDKPYLTEPTLELLTKEYDIIIFKHCYPVSNIKEDIGKPDPDSEERRIENYKLQYDALKKKMHEFPDNKFIIWTPAVQVKNHITADEAKRTQEFYNWIMAEWNEKGDNIYIWDFYKYETDGGLYFKDEYSGDADNSHPGKEFAGNLAPIFAKFIFDIAKGEIQN